MAIPSINDALQSQAAAIKYLNSTEATAEGKSQLLAKWGADNILKWTSVDTTKYEISDDDFDSAKDAGEQKAKDATGYDGHKSYKAVVDTAVTVGAHIVGQTVVKNAIAPVVDKITAKSIDKAGIKNNVGNQASFIVGCTMGLAEGLRYKADKPNEDQVNAARELFNANSGEGLLADNQEQLALTQEEMATASEEATALTEEAELVNEEANEKNEEDKVMFDFYRAQYEAVKAKADGGEKLSQDEKDLLKKLAPLMEQLGVGINDREEETSDTVNELNDNIGEYQDTFDESAESMAEVEGVTDYAEGFDSNTQVMCCVEGAGQSVNAGMSAISSFKAGKFALSGGWFTAWAWVFAGMGATGSYLSGKGATEQFGWAGEVGAEIDAREATQQLNSDTNDIYETELDNYGANIEIVEDLELEIPEDMDVPDAPANTDGTQGNQDASLFTIAAENDEKKEDDKKNKDVK